MRTACLVLVMIGSAALAAHAVPSDAASQRAAAENASKASSDHRRGDEHTAAIEDRAHTGKHSAEQQNHYRASGQNLAHSLARVAKPNRPKHVLNDHDHSMSKNANVQQTSNKPSRRRADQFRWKRSRVTRSVSRQVSFDLPCHRTTACAIAVLTPPLLGDS